MDHQEEAGAIRWRDWSEEAFLAAKREGKPVLLTLSATWCHWCHVMDQTSYSDSRVIRLVNSKFIPVRVDVDQRPDIGRRYNQGGYPSVALLSGQRELIAGRVYVPPVEMAQLLEQVSAGYPEWAVAGAGPEYNQVSRATSQSGTGADPVARVLQRLEELYDPDLGGFGREPKQPPWEALRFLLARYSRSRDRRLLKMVVQTLDSMSNGLYDQKDQGFFRYSVSRDWRVPHYEKMLVTNANLALLYLEAFQVTGKAMYRRTASGVLDYLLGTLYDSRLGSFYASQDAGEEYYRLPWKDRQPCAAPSVDHTGYTGWNALAATSLVKAFGVLGKPQYLRVARQVLDRLWRESWKADLGLSHVIGAVGKSHSPPVLEDHLYCLRAFLDLYQATGETEHLHRASTLAACIQKVFAAPDGGFYDIPESSSSQAGLLSGEKPLLENSLLAEALVILACLTGENAYLDLARTALEAFHSVAPGHSYVGNPGSRRMEEDEERLFLPAASAWGRAWDMLDTGPVHLVLVGNSTDANTRGLLEAALRKYAPHQVVQLLDQERDQERIQVLGFPERGGPALYACMGGMCLAPVTTPSEVKELAIAGPWATFSGVSGEV